MRVFPSTQIDPLNAFQPVDAGGGKLEIYARGIRKGTYQVGEAVIKYIDSRIEFLTDDRAQQLVQSYCEVATRHSSRLYVRPASSHDSLRSRRAI